MKSKIYKFIRRGSEFILRKDFLLFFTLGLVLVFFKSSIELFLTDTIVTFALGKINTNWYTDLAFLSIILALFILTIARYKKYVISRHFFFILTISSIIYIPYRIREAVWEFTAFYFWPVLRYADILLVISISQLLLLVPRKKRKIENGGNSFFDDNPIGLKGEDKLGYGPYAEHLAGKILSSNFNKSFAVGINGKWGLGKTSFIDLLKRHLKDDHIIEINFNPWSSQSPSAIIKDFFATLHGEIWKYHSSLSTLFVKYSDRLAELNSNKVTQTVQKAISVVSDFDSIDSLYDDINEALEAIDKKIVIYVDDLDRLDSAEVVEVIRLVRNTANFHNTFFIVAYDRNYVINALKQHTLYKQEEFLEKIFQIEITLPYFDRSILRSSLAEKLKKKFSAENHATIDREIIGTPSNDPVYLDEWLESMRDVTRLANAFILNYNKLLGEVQFDDFMRMELLRLKYQSAYELVFRRTTDFFHIVSSSISSKENYYELKRLPDSEKGEKTVKRMEYYFEQYLYAHHLSLSIPQNDIPKIVSLLESIFSNPLSYSMFKRSHLSIVYPSKFNRYFAYNLLSGNLSEVKFSEARLLTQAEFDSKIEEWVRKEMAMELRNRFREIKNFNDQDDFEKVIRAIFHFAHVQIRLVSLNKGIPTLYDGKDLYNKLSNYDGSIVKKYYPSNGENEFKTFIKTLLESAPSPYLFEANFIRFINDQLEPAFPLSKEELTAININYLKKYCSQQDRLDSYVWDLFYACQQTEYTPTGANSFQRYYVMPPSATMVLKDFLLNKDFKGFLEDIIQHNVGKKGEYAINEIVVAIFGSWKDFENQINKMDDNDHEYLSEFKRFVTVFASKNYSQFVPFEFNKLKK